MNSLIRGTSVIVVMVIVAFAWSNIGTVRLRKRGMEEAAARTQAGQEARKYSLIAAFLYMVAMVSVAGLFL